MNPETVNNYLNNGLKFAKDFVQNVVQKAESNIYESRYGYGSTLKNIGKYVQHAAKENTVAKKAVTATAGVINDLLTDQTRREWWKYTNVPRMAGQVARAVATDLGMGGTLAGAALTAAAFPINQFLSVGGGRNIKEGFRPKGHKSLVPASKEIDPTGRTPLSAPVEIPVRFLTGRPGELLPYQAFKQDRPDILPSQYVSYRRYVQKKNEPGKLITIDPETGTFVTAQGIVKGSVEGLAGDPEIRVMGRPVTASSLAGLGAGYAAMKGLQAATKLPVSEKIKITSERLKVEEQFKKVTASLSTDAKKAGYTMPGEMIFNEQAIQENIKKVKEAGGVLKALEALRDKQPMQQQTANTNYFRELKELSKKLRGNESAGKQAEELHQKINDLKEKATNIKEPVLNIAQQAGQALGPYKNLAVAGAGIATALGVGYATKKALQKASEERIKKDNPVEYLKHKHGSLEAASVALGQPNARSWEQLIPHM